MVWLAGFAVIPPILLAQFQLPPPRQEGRPATQKQLPTVLKYQYAFGTESDIRFRSNNDVDSRLRDSLLVLSPQLNAIATYRPTKWLDMTMEVVLEREWAIKEDKQIILPTGESQFAENRRLLLVLEQMFVNFKPIRQFELGIGRRNFEDDRHWLYDTALDVAVVRFRLPDLNAEFSVGRKDLVKVDLLKPAGGTGGALPQNIDPATVGEEGRKTENFIAYAEYRRIEDIKLAAYTIYRNDRSGSEGRPLFMGLRATGKPSDSFRFWGDFAILRGSDEFKRSFRATAVDVGATYVFTRLPMYPTFTLGYAHGTGDANPDDGKNLEFRQTGLQSNEGRFAGVVKFKYYGEVLDPELSNIQILTAAFGFRPAANVYVDLVWHRYQLNKLADEIRNWQLTAQMSQVDTHLSKDVGNALDVIIGFRRLFGVQKLGLDVRVGFFFPGKAFLRNEGDEDNPHLQRPDNAVSLIARFRY
jgi:alginate production protein